MSTNEAIYLETVEALKLIERRLRANNYESQHLKAAHAAMVAYLDECGF